MVRSSFGAALTLAEGFIFFCISFMGRVSRIGLGLNPIYMGSSLVGMYGSLMLEPTALTVRAIYFHLPGDANTGTLCVQAYISCNLLLNAALVGVAAYSFAQHGEQLCHRWMQGFALIHSLPQGSAMGFYFYGPGYSQS